MQVFPEGTCVNNEYVVMFKRGAFELGTNRRAEGRGVWVALTQTNNPEQLILLFRWPSSTTKCLSTRFGTRERSCLPLE